MKTRTLYPLLIALLFTVLLGACDHGDSDTLKPSPSETWKNGIGTGEPGFDNGPGNKAQFLAPYGVATDKAGNIYVSEQPMGSLGIIRKIMPDGTVSTLAGGVIEGFSFYRDGPVKTALFFGTFGVATDNQGNVYVSDATNNRIRKIAGGMVSTVIYDENIAPYGIATDAQGNIYTTDLFSNRIFKITPDGKKTTAANTGGFGIAIDAQNNIYVADQDNNRIRKITASGVSNFAGNGVAGFTEGQGTTAQFNNPSGVAVDAQGNVYVADEGNNRIRKITSAGVVSTFAGDGSSAQLSHPTGVAVDNNNEYLYVSDKGNYKIRRIKL